MIRQVLTLILAFVGGFLVVGGWIWAPQISGAMSSFVSVGPSVSLFADANRLGRPEVAAPAFVRLAEEETAPFARLEAQKLLAIVR